MAMAIFIWSLMVIALVSRVPPNRKGKHNLLKSSALPAMTGLEARAPMFQRPSTAVARVFYGIRVVLVDGHARNCDTGRACHRQVLLIVLRLGGGNLVLARFEVLVVQKGFCLCKLLLL